MTGKLSWNTLSVTEGDYSVQIVTRDLQTGLRVAVEVLIRLSSFNDLNTTAPNVLFVNDPFSLDIVYTVPGSTIDLAIEVNYDDDLYDLYPLMLSPSPDDFESDIDIYDERGNTIRKC